jgi:hypothetical protein
MRAAYRGATIGLLFIVLWEGDCGGRKDPAVLEQAYELEPNPRKRADLARDLMDQRLETLGSFLSSGTMLEERSPRLGNYLAALDRLETAVQEAAHTGTSKRAEIHLRRHLNRLENFKLTVSVLERSVLEELIARLEEVREEVLYSIMFPPEAG